MNGTEDNTYREAGSTGAATPQDVPNYGAANQGYTGSPYTGPQVPPVDPYAGAGYPPPYGYPATPPPPPGTPNPGLATLLGFIPGVGAMYNGQFAKGIAHIVIFAVLTSLADHVNGIFGLLVAGWVFYMVFDAYQTARARRDGLVIPDPFGLNNIGERFGLQGSPQWGDFVARPAAGASAASGNTASSADPVQAATAYTGAATDPVTGAPIGAAYGTAVPPAYTQQPYSYAPPAAAYPGASYAAAVDPAAYPPGTVPPPYAAAYGNAYAPYDPAMAAAPPLNRSGLPTGAIWLIGLGVLFLIGSLGHNFYWSGRFAGAFILLAIGIVLLVQRTLASRNVYPSGSAASRWNLVHQNRGGIYLVVIGTLQALHSLDVARWHYTWPYMLIAFGLFQLLDRVLYNRMLAEGPVYPNGYPPVSGTSASAPAATNADDAPAANSGQEVR